MKATYLAEAVCIAVIGFTSHGYPTGARAANVGNAIDEARHFADSENLPTALSPSLLGSVGVSPASNLRKGAASGEGIAGNRGFVEPAGAYRVTSEVGGPGDAGLLISPVSYLDDIDGSKIPDAPERPALDLFGAPGERVPATFLIVAKADLRRVDIGVTPLASSGKGVSPRDIAAVRQVVRTPMRATYTASSTETVIVNRFLPRWQRVDISKGEFREVWLSFDVPEGTPPGVWSGVVTVRHDGGQRLLPIRLCVLPITLRDHPVKHLAIYYGGARRLDNPKLFAAEMEDIRRHGIRDLYSGLTITYRGQGDRITADFGSLRRGLELIRRAGFKDCTVVVGDGLELLAGGLGHRDVADGDGASLDGDPRFWRIARESIDGFLAFGRKEFPEFRFALTHMDEVFRNAGAMRLYTRLSRAVRQVPAAKLYITLHMFPGRATEEMLAAVRPYVDLRNVHGMSFDAWLGAGHAMSEFERGLGVAGSAWTYRNMTGEYPGMVIYAEYVNGFYLWASPFSDHCPWIYAKYFGNPFDDTDGPERVGHDWGFAFPSAGDPTEIIPTRIWEAMRKGADDLRYIAVLEREIAEASEANRAVAHAASLFLDDERRMIREGRPVPTPTSRSTGSLDLPTGDPRELRATIADWILRLSPQQPAVGEAREFLRGLGNHVPLSNHAPSQKPAHPPGDSSMPGRL